MFSALTFIVILGFIVFIHELGHFSTAKWLKVRVEAFSLGFPPKLIGFRRGETDYMISWIPIGGYVKLTGEIPNEETLQDARALCTKSIPQRALIFSAGVLMNILSAWLLMSVVYMMGKEIPAYLQQPPVIGWVEKDSPASQSGLQIDDRILTIDGQEMKNWQETIIKVGENPGKPLVFQWQRNGEIFEKTITPEMAEKLPLGRIGIAEMIEARVGGTLPGWPAEEAGLAKGDLILAINGEAVNSWSDLTNLVRVNPGKALEFKIKREAKEFLVNMTPRVDEQEDLAEDAQAGKIGISRYQEMITERYSPLKAFSQAALECADITVKTYQVVFDLLLLKRSLKQLIGPVAVAGLAGDAAAEGLNYLLYFAAFISLQLGLVNLLPIPALDGGHLLLLGIEAVRRKPLSIRKAEIAQQIGFALLITLMIYICFNDIVRFLPDIEKFFK